MGDSAVRVLADGQRKDIVVTSRYSVFSRIASMATVLTLGVAVVGCNDNSDALPPPATHSPTPSPTPTIDPQDAAAFEAVEDYLEAFTAALTEEGEVETLASYSSDTHANRIESHVDANRRENVIFVGAIAASSMQIVEREQAPGPTESAAGPGLLVETCLSGHDWRLVDRDSGDLMGPDPESNDTRHTGRFMVFPSDDGDWWARFTVPIPQWAFGLKEEYLEPC